MPTMADLQSANAGFEQQMQEWKQQRFANGENPLDWTAFRDHLMAVGAPDPGEAAPDEFYRWDESMAGGTPDKQVSELAAQGDGSPGSPGSVSDSGDTGTWPPQAGSGTTTSKWPQERSYDS